MRSLSGRLGQEEGGEGKRWRMGECGTGGTRGKDRGMRGQEQKENVRNKEEIILKKSIGLERTLI